MDEITIHGEIVVRFVIVRKLLKNDIHASRITSYNNNHAKHDAI